MPENQDYVQIEEHGDVHVGTIRNSGVVEATRVGVFGKFLLEYVGKYPGVKLLLCFRNVEYMSSSTLTELIKVKETAEESGGRLGICSLRPDVRRVFEITNLEEHLNVYAFDTIEDAIAAFGEDA